MVKRKQKDKISFSSPDVIINPPTSEINKLTETITIFFIEGLINILILILIIIINYLFLFFKYYYFFIDIYYTY